MPYVQFNAPRTRHLFANLFIFLASTLILAGCATSPQTNSQEETSPSASARFPDDSSTHFRGSAKDRKVADAYISYIVKHYSISKKGARIIIDAVMTESQKHRIDRSLITAVIAVESRFNPYALSRSNAEGLMQIIPRWHPDKMAKIGGDERIVDTKRNIAAGTLALKEYLNKHNQNVALALQQYNGSLGDPKRKYSSKVLAEKRRIDHWVTARS